MQNVNQPLSLIVGGSSGIGLATARLLLQRDIKTVIVGKSKEKLEAAKRTPFLAHTHEDYDVYLDLNRAAFLFHKRSQKT